MIASLPRLVLALSLLAPCAATQSTFDHFTGNKLNEQVWWPWGRHSARTISKSIMSISLPSDTDVGVASMGEFQGDFDFILDFSALKVTGTGTNYAGVNVNVLGTAGPLKNENSIFMGIGGNAKVGLGFNVDSLKGNKQHGSAVMPTKATAGELRIRRVKSQKMVYAMYRPSGTTAWTTLKSWPDWLPEGVLLGIEAYADPGTTLSVQHDQIQALSKPVQSYAIYGSGCLGMRARPYGLPKLGNNYFGIFLEDETFQHAGQPVLFLVGFTKLNVNFSIFGAPGCSLYASPDLAYLAGLMNQDSEIIAYLPIPAWTPLVGVKVYCQHLVVSKKNSFGFAFSNGSEATVIK